MRAPRRQHRRADDIPLPPLRRWARLVWWPTLLGMATVCCVIVLGFDHVGHSGYQPVWPALLILNGVIALPALVACPGMHLLDRWRKRRKNADEPRAF